MDKITEIYGKGSGELLTRERRFVDKKMETCEKISARYTDPVKSTSSNQYTALVIVQCYIDPNLQTYIFLLGIQTKFTVPIVTLLCIATFL